MIQKNKKYEYIYEDEQVIGTVTNVSESQVVTSLGHVIELETFENFATEMDEEDNQQGVVMPKINFDKNGLPFLKQNDGNQNQEDFSEMVSNESPFPEGPQRVQVSTNEIAINTLITNAKKQTINLKLNLEVELINKDLFSILENSFPDDKDAVISNVVNLLDLVEIKKQLEAEIKKHYSTSDRALAPHS